MAGSLKGHIPNVALVCGRRVKLLEDDGDDGDDGGAFYTDSLQGPCTLLYPLFSSFCFSVTPRESNHLEVGSQLVYLSTSDGNLAIPGYRV